MNNRSITCINLHKFIAYLQYIFFKKLGLCTNYISICFQGKIQNNFNSKHFENYAVPAAITIKIWELRYAISRMFANLWLFENSVNSQDMIKDFIEQHQWNIQLFFVKHLHINRDWFQYSKIDAFQIWNNDLFDVLH